MPRKEQPVKVTILDEAHSKGTERREHPAMGNLAFSRCTGRVKLHGSALEHHDEFISMTVCHANVDHHLGRDWHHALSGRPVLEVRMSHAQFAQAITGMNIGAGVPCTLGYINGDAIPLLPWDQPTESTKVVEAFKREVAMKVAAMRVEVDRLRALLDQKTVTKGERMEAIGAVERFARLYDDSAPFMVDSFSEAAEKVVTHAKAEVEAFAHRVMIETGTKVLREQAEEQRQLAAPPPRAEE